MLRCPGSGEGPFLILRSKAFLILVRIPLVFHTGRQSLGFAPRDYHSSARYRLRPRILCLLLLGFNDPSLLAAIADHRREQTHCATATIDLKYSSREKLQEEEGRTLRGRSNTSFLASFVLTIMAIIPLTYQHNF